MEKKIYKKECPSCGEIIYYGYKNHLERSINNNSKCKKCVGESRIGDKHPMYGKVSTFKGKKHTEESKKLISQNHKNVSGINNPMFGLISAMYGKHHTDETKLKISLKTKGKIRSDETKKNISKSKIEFYKNNPNPTKGRKHSNESKIKMRLSRIKLITESKFNGHQFYPSYNKNSISIIEEYGIENNLKIQHAENGGEYYIEELGYWVDGYDIEKNVVIEYNESHHKYQIKKDIDRRNEIIRFLKCEFIVINENKTVEKYKF